MAEQPKGTPEVWAAGIGRKSNAQYGSDLMAEMLRELGIKYIALNPGASYRGLHDSLVNFESGKGPEMIMCTHEEIAVAIANGYARATGEIMATGLHNIVGLQHASMAIFNAWCDRTPILNLGGGGPQDTTNRRSTDWVHTALVQGNAVREYVKFDDQPNSVDAVAESFLKAYRIAMTEPKGPVYICLDTDVQEAKVEKPMVVPHAQFFRPPAGPGANPESLRSASRFLAEAQWPVIVAGEVGRNPKALPPMLDLAEALGAPVVDSDGRFAFPSTHPLNLTNAREEALRGADVVLALDVPSLGVPLGPSVRERGNFAPIISPSCKVIHITLLDLERQSWVSDNMWLLPVHMPMAADTAVVLPQLLEQVRERLSANKESAREVQRRDVVDHRIAEHVFHRVGFLDIRTAFPDHDAQLDFPVHFFGHAGMQRDAVVGSVHRGRRLGEEGRVRRQLGHVRPRLRALLEMLQVVPAYAEHVLGGTRDRRQHAYR